MAIRTISNAGGNWNALGTWAEGIVPTSADDVVATGTSGNATINVNASCRSIDLTGYTGTLTLNSAINSATIADSPEKTEKILAMREQYRIATRLLCELAGESIRDKLEDIEYLQVRIKAAQNNLLMSTVYTETIAYCLNTLRLDDVRDAWDRI